MTPIFHSSATYVYVWNKRKILKFKIGFCGVIYGVHVSPSTRAWEKNIIWAEKTLFDKFWQNLSISGIRKLYNCGRAENGRQIR